MPFFFPVTTEYDPTLPTVVHPAGVTPTGRWIADTLPLGAVASWKPLVGGVSLTPPSGAAAPVVKTDAAGFRYVEFRSGQALAGALTGSGYGLVTVVARIPAGRGSGPAFMGGGANLNWSSGFSRIESNRSGGAAENEATGAGTAPTGRWLTLTLTVDSPQTASTIRVSGISGAPRTTTATGIFSTLTIGAQGGTAYPIDVAEIIYAAGTVPPISPIEAAMRSYYGT
ncbi:hypothetical protein J2Y69_003057 [Microbacterium resistens]|uniref:Concanavalin A-like lectin/glucanases superfamily protein n=1 Tax=Microbacterium resistens TaxID=156977 RepID=A0ABU1SFS3_9MICO|nr:hypothetical protein [Microbacterium resistens]MDR6868441.1 hypothetical protein [Microbacterium resistens]